MRRRVYDCALSGQVGVAQTFSFGSDWHFSDMAGLADDVRFRGDTVAKVENRSVPEISRKRIFGLSAAASPFSSTGEVRARFG